MPHSGAAEADEETDDANTDSFFDNFFEPQCGQGVPCHLLERTNSSNSLSQRLQ